MADLLQKLRGGNLRSIGRVDEVVADVLADSSAFPILMEGMSHSDPVVRMRAADAVEKITRTHPSWLNPYKQKLIEEVSRIDQKEVQWHLAQLFPRLELTVGELNKVVYLLRQWVENSQSKIVIVNALQALCDLALRYPDMIPSAVHIIQEAVAKGSPAVISRGKKLLKVLKLSLPQGTDIMG